MKYRLFSRHVGLVMEAKSQCLPFFIEEFVSPQTVAVADYSAAVGLGSRAVASRRAQLAQLQGESHSSGLTRSPWSRVEPSQRP